MSKDDRTVYRRNDGSWVNKRNDSDRASSLHTTQKDAENTAKTITKNQGCSEVTVKGENGRIRSKDTVKPANDPNPLKDKEH